MMPKAHEAFLIETLQCTELRYNVIYPVTRVIDQELQVTLVTLVTITTDLVTTY